MVKIEDQNLKIKNNRKFSYFFDRSALWVTCFIAMILVLALSLSACGVSSIEELADTAVAQTKTARLPKSTKSPTSTKQGGAEAIPETKEPPQDETLVITPSPTATQTPTPDVRVIKSTPRSFLLDRSDLPEEANYYIPSSNWISPQRNYEVIYELGELLGREYIERTGRLDGWWVIYRRGTSRVLAPAEVYHNIVMYQDAGGARLTVKEYNLGTREDRFEYLDLGQDLGDVSVVMFYGTVDTGGRRQVTYRIETAYRNYVSVIMVTGQENDTDYEFAETIAWKILQKLEQADVENPEN